MIPFHFIWGEGAGHMQLLFPGYYVGYYIGYYVGYYIGYYVMLLFIPVKNGRSISSLARFLRISIHTNGKVIQS